jgi:hypothetical protein
MSRKSRVLKDVSFEDAGINLAVNPSVNSVFRCRLFLMRVFKADQKQLNLAEKDSSDKSGDQVYIPLLYQFAKVQAYQQFYSTHIL